MMLSAVAVLARQRPTGRKVPDGKGEDVTGTPPAMTEDVCLGQWPGRWNRWSKQAGDLAAGGSVGQQLSWRDRWL